MKEKGIREMGRELALLSLFITDREGMELNDVLSFKWFTDMGKFSDENGELLVIPDSTKDAVFAFARDIISGTIGNLDKIDSLIRDHLQHWSFERLHGIDKALLRLSIYSLVYQPDIPSEVIIAEANDLAGDYGNDNAPNYINGILHRVKEKVRGTAKPAVKIKLKKPGKDHAGH